MIRVHFQFLDVPKVPEIVVEMSAAPGLNERVAVGDHLGVVKHVLWNVAEGRQPEVTLSMRNLP